VDIHSCSFNKSLQKLRIDLSVTTMILIVTLPQPSPDTIDNAMQSA